MLVSDPRGMFRPAEPALTTRCDANVEVEADLPTNTVLPVPTPGATSGWNPVGNVPVGCGTGSHVFHPPGCHIHPDPGTKNQFPYRYGIHPHGYADANM